jgi:hypothetical protein
VNLWGLGVLFRRRRTIASLGASGAMIPLLACPHRRFVTILAAVPQPMTVQAVRTA